MDRLLTYKAVAELLSCSRSTIERMVRDGKLKPPVHYDGVGPRWRESYIQRYLIIQELGNTDEEK